MKKKVAKYVGLLIFSILVIIAVYNIYNWIVCGNQNIKINTSSKAYANSELYVSVIAQDNGVDLDTKTKIKLLDSKGKTVKGVNTTYDGNNAMLKIPQIEAGNYFIEAKVSSKKGKDTVKKEIYISDGNIENATITLDKGIYKPGDTVNFRALITAKEDDKPISKDINVCIYDGNDNKVYNENMKSSDYGIISGNFVLANEVNSGLYKIVIKTNSNETTKQFKVNPYVTPKYEVKLSYDRDNYLVGQTANININTKYFFGEAVQNADITVYIDNQKYKTLKTDEQGNATVDYQIKEAKTYNVKVEAVDSSNYFVDETSKFTAGTDIFEIQLLPEYGTLVLGRKNNVYVFTNQADGTPVKTYVTVSSDNFTKQIATDENGIGQFSIDIAQTTNNSKIYNNTKQFSVTAEDTNKNIVTKNISLNTERLDLILSTDKIKYEQGEDIKLNVSSLTENEKNIYFFKGNKLVKMLSTNLDETTLNLNDTYGLIDIYIIEKTEANKNLSKYYKRTIFIKPDKQLNISINTDKEEYKPGENITISFNTSDENNTNVDAALLVSMLDNSILNLANNDLSIDNIKMALSDIQYTNDIDAATLYSCIINDSSEQTMMALLLEQSYKDLQISESVICNSDQKAKAEITSFILMCIIVLTVICILCVKSKKLRNIIKHILNFIIYDLILVVTSVCMIDDFMWSVDYSWLAFGITTIIGLATYIALVSRLHKDIYRTSVSIIITSLLFVLLTFLIKELEINLGIIALILALIVLIYVIIAKVSKAKNLKINKYIKVINREIIYILKFIVVLIISYALGYVLPEISGMGKIIVPLCLIWIYVFNYLLNIRGKEKVQEETEPNNKENTTRQPAFYVLIVLAIIGIMAIGYIVINAFVNANRFIPYQDQSIRPNISTNYGSSSSNDTLLDSIGSITESFTTESAGTKRKFIIARWNRQSV